MITKQEIIVQIEIRIKSLEFQIETANKCISKKEKKVIPNLKQRLSVQNEALEFNEWLMWRKQSE